MRRPALLAVALAVLTVLAPATAVAAPGAVPADGSPANEAGAPDAAQTAAPEDPDEDVLGWEDGYWYNESVDVDAGDGLDEDELDAVVARAMARVEEVRGLEFEERVPVDIYTREQFREESARFANNTTGDDRLHQNVKYEALFMVGEDTDAVGVQQSNQGASIGGYYSPAEERIVVVSENADSPRLNEITLAQELFHALQDQHYDLTSFNQSTRERHNAVDGIVEGDGNYVDHLYQQRCELPDDHADAWGDCLADDAPADGASNATGQDDVHLGLYLVVYQPYSDGPTFVREIHERGGWEAVNAVYDDPPASTEQVIHPEKYGEDDPAEVTIEDRSNDEWNVLDLEGGVDHAEFGEAGIASMFIYPTYATGGQDGLISPRQFLNLNDSGGVDAFDPIEYDQPWSNGWDGDRLLPYVSEDAEANETGYVWKLRWDSAEEAEEFADGYRQLLAFHGATQVGQNTWVVEDGPFADAFHLEVDGATTTVVNAPTVEDLSGVDGSVSVEETANGSEAGGSNEGGGDATDGGSSGFGPGFGVTAALVAALAAALLARRG